MVTYMGESSLYKIQDCSDLLKLMMKDIHKELSDNDYRNHLPEVARNAQVVEKSTGLFWLVTVRIGGRSSDDDVSVDTYASTIPGIDQLGTNHCYGLNVMCEVESGSIVRGVAVVRCAGEITPNSEMLSKTFFNLVRVDVSRDYLTIIGE